MNAAAIDVDRDRGVEEQIRKVRRFGRNARAVCIFLFIVLALAGAFGLATIASGAGPKGINLGLGAYTFSADQIVTPALKIWVALVFVVVLGIAAAALQRALVLFGNLARGSIYTAANVQLLRHLGMLMLLMAVLGLVIPVATAVLIRIGIIDTSAITDGRLMLSSNSLGSFIAAGLVLLASWIMDVGLHTKDHADELERDADLVI
jgi:uncharacterized membrane protein YjgN (DUF898 family)